MSVSTPEISFPQYFRGPHAETMQQGLQAGVDEFAQWWDQREDPLPYKDITVAMYSFGDSKEAVERAFEGIGEQIYVDHDNVQLVFVDSGTRSSGENTAARAVAMDYGATIGSVAVGPTFRPDLLNKGLELAEYPHVVSMSAHSVPATNVMLAAGRRRFDDPDNGIHKVGGVYGVPLPDDNASWVERRGAHFMGATERINSLTEAKVPGVAGYLDASCSMIDKQAVNRIGEAQRPPTEGYPADYGAGGMDGRLGEQMDAGWYTDPEAETNRRLLVVQERLLAVHHTHGFGLIKSGIQVASWLRMSRPRDYNPKWGLWHPNRGL